MGLWIPLFFVLVTTSCTTAQKWKVEKTGSITIPDGSCNAIKLDVKEKTVARITIKDDLPGDCITSDFSMYENLDIWHIHDNAADACAQFDVFSADYRVGSPSRESGFTCTGTQTFFFPIEASCFGGFDPTLTYTIETRPLDEKEAERCTTTEQGWKAERSGKIAMPRFSCEVVGFKVKKRSVARIIMQPGTFGDCPLDDFSVNKALNISSSFSSEEDACSITEFDSTLADNSIGFKFFTQDSDFNCTDTQTLFYPIDSSCPGDREGTFIYTIETRPLEGEEAVICKAFDTAKDIATGLIVALVIIPILIIVGIVLCCCFCSRCPCYYKRNQQAAVTTSTTAAPQHEMVGYPQPEKPV